jgi:hypothetical protein
LVVASLPLILAYDGFGLTNFILNPWVLLGLAVLLSGLLVAEIPLFALKFKNLSWQDNSLRFVFLLLAIGSAVGGCSRGHSTYCPAVRAAVDASAFRGMIFVATITIFA